MRGEFGEAAGAISFQGLRGFGEGPFKISSVLMLSNLAKFSSPPPHRGAARQPLWALGGVLTKGISTQSSRASILGRLGRWGWGCGMDLVGALFEEALFRIFCCWSFCLF